MKSISSFRGESDIKTWLFTIARHRWFAYLTRKNRQIQTESIHDLYDSAVPGTMDPQNDAAELIRQCLSGESGLTQKVVKMRIEGYSYYEIAVKLRIAENSARVVYFRAIDFVLQMPRPEEGPRPDKDIRIDQFLYEEIYEEDLADRIAEAHTKREADDAARDAK